MFLNAQSQMWIFAAYEVMRTWRQRTKDMIKWHKNGGLQLKLNALEANLGFVHDGNLRRASMVRAVIADPKIVDNLSDDLKRTHTDDGTVEDLREYCISTIREFHSGGLHHAGNLAHYERAVQGEQRLTTVQLVALYQQLVRNDQARRIAALTWLQRYFPAEAKAHMQRIAPHSELWFSIIDRVEPRLGLIARMNIACMGTNTGCSSCGNPADDYLC